MYKCISFNSQKVSILSGKSKISCCKDPHHKRNQSYQFSTRERVILISYDVRCFLWGFVQQWWTVTFKWPSSDLQVTSSDLYFNNKIQWPVTKSHLNLSKVTYFVHHCLLLIRTILMEQEQNIFFFSSH